MKKILLHALSDYGSVFVLIGLCAYYSYETISVQHPVSPEAGEELADTILAEAPNPRVVIVTRDTKLDRQFGQAIAESIRSAQGTVLASLAGTPREVRQGLEAIADDGGQVDYIATNHFCSNWGFLEATKLSEIGQEFAGLKTTRVVTPQSYRWPSFLTRENLLNVVKNNAEIAIIAIGMTMVIITAGIDLSVGSVLALSGVITAVTIQSWAGGAAATPVGLIGCSMVGIGVCALCGAFNGVMITLFRIPAFVVTLGMMMIARGLSLIIAVRYQSALAGGTTEGTPEAVKIQADSFSVLGNGEILGIPNPIWLMLLLYILAHVLMMHTSIGRYIYAVGGNAEAARLSGVPVMGVIILVYALCGAMAGLGGIVDASRFEGGRPNAGELYELQVIAAVVVGGASLAGGEGRVFGTLVGALIIAVIQNGLNMAGVKSYEQKVIFGALILAAVFLDQLKKRNQT